MFQPDVPFVVQQVPFLYSLFDFTAKAPERAGAPAIGNSLGKPGITIAAEAVPDEPLAVNFAGHHFQVSDPPIIILNQLIIRRDNTRDLSLGFNRRHNDW